MGNLIDIQSQIEKLQKQAADIRSREFNSTVQDILAKMQAFGITVKDLSAGLKKAPKTRGRPAGKAKAYQGPNGETWGGGRGKRPNWVNAILAAGGDIEDYKV